MKRVNENEKMTGTFFGPENFGRRNFFFEVEPLGGGGGSWVDR